MLAGKCPLFIEQETAVLSLTSLFPLAAIAPDLALATIPAIAPPAIPEPARFLPRDTAYVVLLDTRAETWQALEHYAFFEMLTAGSTVPPNPGGLPFLPPELDYLIDIDPWLADSAALALLPLETAQPVPLAEHEVLLAPIDQPAEFKGFVDGVAALRTHPPTTQTYQDLEIIYWEPEFPEATDEDVPIPGEKQAAGTAGLPLTAAPAEDPEVALPEAPEPDVPGLAIAVLPDLMVAAETPAAIRAWIDLQPAHEDDSLAAEERFHRTLAHPHYEAALGVFYGNLSELVKYSLSDFSELDLPIPLPSEAPPQELADLTSLQLDSTLEVLIYPQPEGLRLQGRGYYDGAPLPAGLPLPASAPGQVLVHVPAASYLMLSGQDLATAWETLATSLEATPETANFLNQVRGFFQGITGLTLDEEFFGWMDGEYTVFLFPTRQTPLTQWLPGLQVGLGMALQTRDRAAAEYAFSQLDQRLGQSFGQVETQQINNIPVTNWLRDLTGDAQPDSFLSYGWAEDDTLLLTTSLGSLQEVLTLSTRQTLPGTTLFRRATQDFPANNQGYFFANVSSTLSLLSPFFPPSSQDSEAGNFRRALGTVQTLSATLSMTDSYVQLDGLLMLSPVDRAHR